MKQKKGEMHKGHRQRFKNRALKSGLESMEPHEVLELILMYTIPYKDVNPLAHELIDHFGSLAGVLDAGYDQLSKFKGVGDETAKFLALLPEMFNSYSASKIVGKVILNNINMCINHFRMIKTIGHDEEFYVFCLDGAYELLQLVKIAEGNSSSVSFETTTLTNKISCKGVRSVLLLHTHPHGDISPSVADFVATKQILTVCYTLGITVEDHVIITDNNYYSFVKSGAFNQLVEDVVGSMTNLFNKEARECIKKCVGFVASPNNLKGN